MNSNQQQATIEAQTAENGNNANPAVLEAQFNLNNFLTELLLLKKNAIQVVSIQPSPQQYGEFVGGPKDFVNAFARSQATDLLYAVRTFGQMQPEVAKHCVNITDPRAITEICVLFSISKTQTVTAYYTLAEARNATDSHRNEVAASPTAPSPGNDDTSAKAD